MDNEKTVEEILKQLWLCGYHQGSSKQTETDCKDAKLQLDTYYRKKIDKELIDSLGNYVHCGDAEMYFYIRDIKKKKVLGKRSYE